MTSAAAFSRVSSERAASSDAASCRAAREEATPSRRASSSASGRFSARAAMISSTVGVAGGSVVPASSDSPFPAVSPAACVPGPPASSSAVSPRFRVSGGRVVRGGGVLGRRFPIRSVDRACLRLRRLAGCLVLAGGPGLRPGRGVLVRRVPGVGCSRAGGFVSGRIPVGRFAVAGGRGGRRVGVVAIGGCRRRPGGRSWPRPRTQGGRRRRSRPLRRPCFSVLSGPSPDAGAAVSSAVAGGWRPATSASRVVASLPKVAT